MRLDKLDQLIDVLYPRSPAPTGEAGKLPAPPAPDERRDKPREALRGNWAAPERR